VRIYLGAEVKREIVLETCVCQIVLHCHCKFKALS